MPEQATKRGYTPPKTPFWDELQEQCGGDYDLACRVICIMRNTLFKVDDVRYHLATDAIRRARYEEAMKAIYGID